MLLGAANAQQSPAQGFPHARQRGRQALRIATDLFRLHAPEQLRHQRQIAARVILGRRLNLRPCRHLGPGASGEIHNVGRHLPDLCELTDALGDLRRQLGALLHLAQCLCFGLALGVLLLGLRLPGGFKGREH